MYHVSTPTKILKGVPTACRTKSKCSSTGEGILQSYPRRSLHSQLPQILLLLPLKPSQTARLGPPIPWNLANGTHSLPHTSLASTPASALPCTEPSRLLVQFLGYHLSGEASWPSAPPPQADLWSLPGISTASEQELQKHQAPCCSLPACLPAD